MKKILVVDDNNDILELICTILDLEGLETCGINDGDELFKTIDNFHPDLILLDIMLGGLDGRELCNLIKRSGTNKHIPVIMISASHEVYSLEEKGCRAEGFISKPFDISILVNKVNDLLAA